MLYSCSILGLILGYCWNCHNTASTCIAVSAYTSYSVRFWQISLFTWFWKLFISYSLFLAFNTDKMPVSRGEIEQKMCIKRLWFFSRSPWSGRQFDLLCLCQLWFNKKSMSDKETIDPLRPPKPIFSRQVKLESDFVTPLKLTGRWNKTVTPSCDWEIGDKPKECPVLPLLLYFVSEQWGQAHKLLCLTSLFLNFSNWTYPHSVLCESLQLAFVFTRYLGESVYKLCIIQS